MNPRSQKTIKAGPEANNIPSESFWAGPFLMSNTKNRPNPIANNDTDNVVTPKVIPMMNPTIAQVNGELIIFFADILYYPSNKRIQRLVSNLQSILNDYKFSFSDTINILTCE